MRVFMLGWEFPPYISGGLGTACYGLTRALSRQEIEVIFVLPRAIGSEHSAHVRMLGPQPRKINAGGSDEQVASSTMPTNLVPGAGDLANVVFASVSSRNVNPYQSAGVQPAASMPATLSGLTLDASRGAAAPVADYAGDMIAESRRYAEMCVDRARGQDFDVIHAHDWMTFPAGLAVARASGRPLVTHVHSTEFDRSGDRVCPEIYDVERQGMHGSHRVIAVSRLTGSIIRRRYGVGSDRIDVVHNGIDTDHADACVADRAQVARGDKVVLFLGRITFQKGPEYFVRAAKRVLQKVEDAKFIMAGSGDRMRDVIELAAREGIGHRVLFAGFLRGADVDRAFRMADVYVMPSVSEPFGIAPLEAIRHGVPVIVSKTAGVCEVLSHALKVDFWDVDEIANKIISVLQYRALSATLREHAAVEVRGITWDAAATRCHDIYDLVRQSQAA